MKITRTLRYSDYFTELDIKRNNFKWNPYTDDLAWTLDKPEQKHTKTYYFTRYIIIL